MKVSKTLGNYFRMLVKTCLEPKRVKWLKQVPCSLERSIMLVKLEIGPQMVNRAIGG